VRELLRGASFRTNYAKKRPRGTSFWGCLLEAGVIEDSSSQMATYWSLPIDHRNPVGGVVADLRARCGEDMQQILRDHFSGCPHFSGVLALPPDERENFLGVVDLIASNREKEAARISAATGVDQECTWSRLESTTNDIITARIKSALRVLQDPDERMNAIQRAGVDRELFRRQHGPPEPRVFRWGGAPEEGELAAIGRVLDEKKACIGAARRYADAVGASFVPYYLAAFRTLLATSLVELTAVESASCVAAISAGDHYDPHRQFVLEAPSRDADGVPLLSRSEIDRVVPATFGVAWAWAALPTDGQDRMWQQACALLVAEALYEARRKQLAG